jgi:hypothetical protein
MPGIYELRTTAQRTGQYLGHSKAEYGPTSRNCAGVKAPEWCEFTVYRWNPHEEARRVPGQGAVSRKSSPRSEDGKANSRWSKAPIQMLTKCTKPPRSAKRSQTNSAANRRPKRWTASARSTSRRWTTRAGARQAGRVRRLGDGRLSAVADEGDAKLAAAWKASKKEHREYLLATEPEALGQWKERAAADAGGRGRRVTFRIVTTDQRSDAWRAARLGT